MLGFQVSKLDFIGKQQSWDIQLYMLCLYIILWVYFLPLAVIHSYISYVKTFFFIVANKPPIIFVKKKTYINLYMLLSWFLFQYIFHVNIWLSITIVWLYT